MELLANKITTRSVRTHDSTKMTFFSNCSRNRILCWWDSYVSGNPDSTHSRARLVEELPLARHKLSYVESHLLVLPVCPRSNEHEGSTLQSNVHYVPTPRQTAFQSGKARFLSSGDNDFSSRLESTALNRLPLSCQKVGLDNTSDHQDVWLG